MCSINTSVGEQISWREPFKPSLHTGKWPASAEHADLPLAITKKVVTMSFFKP